MTAKSFAIVLVALILITGAHSQFLGRLANLGKTKGNTFFKPSTIEKVIGPTTTKVRFPTTTNPPYWKDHVYSDYKKPVDTKYTVPKEFFKDYTKDLTEDYTTDITTVDKNSNNGFSWYNLLFGKPAETPKNGLTWYNPDLYALNPYDSYKIKEYNNKDKFTYAPWSDGVLVEPYEPIKPDNRDLDGKEENSSKVNHISAQDFTKLNAETVVLDLGTDGHDVDISNTYPNTDGDVDYVDVINNVAPIEELDSLEKNKTVKYFSLEVQNENRTVVIKIGRFQRNLTVDKFLKQFKRIQNITAPIAYIVDNPIVAYAMSKTPLAKPFEMLRTLLKIIQKPEEAYKIFQKKYPMTGVLIDFGMAVYKDPKNIKKHIKDHIPKASEKIVDWHKNKEKEEAAKKARDEEVRSLVAVKLNGIRSRRV